MSTAARTIDVEPYLDFQRYAPAPKPVVVWSQPSAPAAAQPDELVVVWQTIRTAAGIVWRSSGIGIHILALRATNWCDDHILRSLSASWALAGLGWGGLIGISIIQYFAR